MNWKQQMVDELAKELKEHGFIVYLSYNKEYGFYSSKEIDRVVSFSVRLGVMAFSGCYISERCGTGWQICEGYPEDYGELLRTNPPGWATNGHTVKMETVQDHLKRWTASKYELYTNSKLEQTK